MKQQIELPSGEVTLTLEKSFGLAGEVAAGQIAMDEPVKGYVTSPQ